MYKHKSYGNLFITKPFEWEDYIYVLDSIGVFWIKFIEIRMVKFTLLNH